MASSNPGVLGLVQSSEGDDEDEYEDDDQSDGGDERQQPARQAAEIIHDFNYAQVITLDLLAKGYIYLEVPISYHFRTTGESFIKLFPYLKKVVPAVYRELNTVP